jgi:hypothetical protein
MDPRFLFLRDHARVHSAAVFPHERPLLEDFVCNGLTDQQLRFAPAGHCSIAWLIWHMARNEDVAVNTLLRGVPQILDRGGWLIKLGVSLRTQGTGMTDEEVEGLSTRVDVAELRAYRSAVGRETRAWVETLDFDELDAPLDVVAQLARGPQTFEVRAQHLGGMWAQQTRDWVLTWLAVGHNYFHLGEAEHVARTLGRPGL